MKVLQKTLDNRKTLNNNRIELLKYMLLSKPWQTILSKYIEYSNQYSRHGTSLNNIITHKEALSLSIFNMYYYTIRNRRYIIYKLEL